MSFVKVILIQSELNEKFKYKNHFFLTGKNETYINNQNVVSFTQGVLKKNDNNYTKPCLKTKIIIILISS